MPVFAYVAKDQAGKIHRGRIEAPNEKILQKRLQDQGFWIQSVAAEVAKKKKFNPLKAMQKVKMQQISIFCRQFATMINAGVSLVRCLSVLEKQTTNTKLKDIIRDVQNRVEAGETLSRAMSHHPVAFSNLTLGLVRAGEVGGVLDETLDRLAQFMESDIRMRQKIKAAMTYPVLVGAVAIIIVTFLVTFIVPKFMEIFKDFKIEMPAITLALIAASNFMTNPRSIGPALAIIIGFTWGFKKWKKTTWGKRIYDKYKMKVPVFGKLSHNIAVERFCRTLSTLLTSGVPILQALETVSAAIDNETFTDVIMNARARIREGDPIGDPLEKSKLFPAMVVQMIAIGEETGALDQMLGKVADFYAVEVETQLEQLAATIEPLMIVGLGLMVGFIVIAMFMPMIALINGLSGGDDK
ncbi:type IV pilus assembly protein PilC [Abditibacterium utsteinense]|uniref:General secretion pathway protein F n=1 Tax=Abditibacterium utsteinense TaxID=1960156 RepID=A0A2S8SVW3_9BACT|nr:type II secretion system F family protein [Abditibacterium utsteinense]PQV64928.1 type IV pilus assembly protein PilC [Abditibacterium utsteinense]